MDKLNLDEIQFIYKGKEALYKCNSLVDAFVYFHNKKINLVSNEEVQCSIEEELSSLDEEYINVVIAKYELGHFFELDRTFSDELFYILRFKTKSKFEINRDSTVLIEKQRTLSFEEYEKTFKEGYQNLLDGNCYQLNITTPLKYKFDSFNSLVNCFLSSDSLSEYAHFLHLPEVVTLLSNSPESLFEINGDILTTRPIKGTINDDQSIELLTKSEKNNAELNIITDLLRNDLSRIGNNFSKVESMADLLKVPGLYHQFSEISVKLDVDFNLYKVLKAIFPGGSITGAPKKSVLKILDLIENYQRGFYTGSTIIWSKDMKSASINIRTAVTKDKTSTFEYGSGGGVTLLSDARSEYDELLSKAQSFIKIFS